MSRSCLFCCLNKHRKTPSKAEMVTSHGEALDTIEINTGMTAHDRKLIKETGDLIFSKMHIEKKGVVFLIAFFKAYPHHQRFFKAFRNIPPEELKGLPDVANHGRRVMDQMAILVQHVDEPQYIKDQMTGLAERHRGRRVKPRQLKMSSNHGNGFYSESVSDGFSMPLKCQTEVFPLPITESMRTMTIQELITWLRQQDLLSGLTGGLAGRLYATTVCDGTEEQRVLLDNSQTVGHYWGLLTKHNQLKLE